MLKPTDELIRADINAIFETIQLLSIKNKSLDNSKKEITKKQLFQQCYQILENTYNLLEVQRAMLISPPLR